MNTEFIEALEELEREKGIAMDVLLEALEAALISAYKRNFGSLQNVRVSIDRMSGEIKVYARKAIVEEVEDDRSEASLQAARQKDPRYELGDILEVEVTPRDFGRIAAQTAKQVVVQRIREAERGIIYEEFSNREGDIVTGIVQRQDQKNIYIDLGKTEAILGPTEQIPGEQYRHGDRLKTYIVEVKKTTKGPQILVSRTHPGLLKRLFELEVPEIYDGVVELKSVAREAGARSKIAVYSKDENVDPVGACVGPKGMRVQTIVNELKGEKIDIVKWNPEPAKFVANALSPAKVIDVNILENDKIARVVVPDYQLSLAIGKEGQNARLSAKLTGWKIDIKSESQAEELRANDQYYDQEEYVDEYYGDYTAEDYEDGEYTEGDWSEDSGEYSEYDYNDEYDQDGEYYQEGETGKHTAYDDGYDDESYSEEPEGYDQGSDAETSPESGNSDQLEEPAKGKGKKSKKKSDSSKKSTKAGSKRKKLSVEELSEYLEELEEDK
ncbi:MAG: transcription termination factor NusA [Thermincola sp.]|jgi:N utilization substance protein A|nr:transcription termination factor NusA [Thermincola sp.]MDT3701742.1 transcription termination factor NusA [Thermincola sp.]